jgi:hypothetical protein
MTRAAGRRRQRNSQRRTLNRTRRQPVMVPRCAHEYINPVDGQPLRCGEFEDAEIHYVGTVDSHPFIPEKEP